LPQDTMVAPKDYPRRDPRNAMRIRQATVHANAIHGNSGSHMVEQPMCGGKAIHKFLSKKGNKELYKQHAEKLRQHGVPSLTSSDTASTVEVPNHEKPRDSDNQRPVRPNQVSESEAYSYDKLPPNPTYGHPRSFENAPPEREAPQYQSYKFSYQPDHVLKDQPTQQIQQTNPSEGSNPHWNKQSRAPPTQQNDSTKGSGYQHHIQNALPTLGETPADASRVMEALADFDDNVDDSVKLETLRAMRDVVMQQQETLKAMSTQNHTYRRKLGVAQNKFHSFHQCQMNQMTMIEKLQMEKDSFESEALLLREENNHMRQELERLRKYASQDIDTRQGRQPRQPVHPAHHMNQPKRQMDTANWHVQRERESNMLPEDESPWQNFYPHTSENVYTPPLPNLEAYAKQRNLQPSHAAPDPPEEMHTGPNPEDNTRKGEYLRDMDYVRSLLSKYEIDEAQDSFGSNLGGQSNNYHPKFGQTGSSKEGASHHHNHDKNNPISGRMVGNHGSSYPAESLYIDPNAKRHHKFQSQGQGGSNADASRRQNHDQSNQNPRRRMGNVASGHPADSLYIDTADRSTYDNQQKIQQPKSNHDPDQARDDSSQPASMMHYASRGDYIRAKQFAKALNHRRVLDGSRKDQETMELRPSSPTTVGGFGISHSDTREPASSDWEEEDSDSLATIERKRENPLGAAPFSVQKTPDFDGISEHDRHILMRAAYHSRVEKRMHQNQQLQDNISY
jgi:hypothetical protein